MKFAIGFAVPYRTRIARIAGYYRRDGRVISIYDTVTLTLVVAIIALLFLTGIQPLSFTGLVAGMLIIQIFVHRFRAAQQRAVTRSRRGATKDHVVCD